MNQLKHRDYPFPWCISLLNKLSEIDGAILRELDTLESKISQMPKDNIDAPFEEEDLEKIQRYGHLLGILHYVLTFFEIGSREYLPEGIVVAVKDLVRKFDRTAAFVLVPIFEYNYTYLDLMKLLNRALRYAFRDTETLLSGMPGKYAVFGFPLVMKRNVILNSILAHEVGHFIDESVGLSNKILEKVVLEKKKLDRIAKIVEKAKFGERKEVKLTYFITPETLRAQITQLAVKQISEWLKELVSDTIAFQLFGPVFLFSLSSFLLTMVKIDEASSDHPPPRMRIQLLLEEFDRMQYPEILDNLKKTKDKETATKFIGLSKELRDVMDAIEQGEYTEFQELVKSSVEKAIPDIQREVGDLTVTSRYSPAQFRNDVFKLADRLGLIVPPAEVAVGKPAIPVSILNAGALFKVIRVEELYKALGATSNEDKIGARDKLHALISKALELSDIQTQMKSLLKEEV